MSSREKQAAYKIKCGTYNADKNQKSNQGDLRHDKMRSKIQEDMNPITPLLTKL